MIKKRLKRLTKLAELSRLTILTRLKRITKQRDYKAIKKRNEGVSCSRGLGVRGSDMVVD